MNTLHQVKRVIETVRHLKPEQVFYRLYYKFLTVSRLSHKIPKHSTNRKLNIVSYPEVQPVLEITEEKLKFSLLNQNRTYIHSVEWDDQKFGRLWNYNLQYADFLKQHELPVADREKLIHDLYNWLFEGRLLPEPYPASMRIMNVIRFLLNRSDDLTEQQKLTTAVYSELFYLSKRPEYHLSGNHLLENGFAILMGGYFFNHKKWIQLASSLLMKELNEQILDDGAHYEGSPMYHSLLLFRVLEAISYTDPQTELNAYFRKKAESMLSWIQKMSVSCSNFAHFNDSVDGIALSLSSLLSLAGELHITPDLHLPLASSGYRVLKSNGAELIIDTGGIQPDHQPGHSHADSLSFILHVNGKAVITDPGISNYEAGERRDLERSTRFHNTVTINDENSADVWSIFRVGKRPSSTILEMSEKKLVAELQYRLSCGEEVIHKRIFNLDNQCLFIEDEVNKSKATGRFYLAPGIDIALIKDNKLELKNGIMILFSGITQIKEFIYRYNLRFNKQTQAVGVSYDFDHSSNVKIVWENK